MRIKHYPRYTLQTGFIHVDIYCIALNEYKSDSLVYLLCLVTNCDDWLLFRNRAGEPYELIGRV